MAIDDVASTSGSTGESASSSPRLHSLGRRADFHRDGAHLAPDVVGLGAAETHAAAGAAGLRLSVSPWETRIGPWGLVVDQRPGAGAYLRRGSSLVVVVSCRPQVAIPDVTGLLLEAALDRLLWLGLMPLVYTRRPSATVPSGHVASTRPLPGTLAACGSVVALTVVRSTTTREADVAADQGGVS